MAKKYEISAEKMEELQSARKKNRDKNIDRRLQALILYGEGQTGKDISAATGYSRQYLYELYQKYFANGLKAITEKHYSGNRRNMSFEEEAAFLEQFILRLMIPCPLMILISLSGT